MVKPFQWGRRVPAMLLAGLLLLGQAPHAAASTEEDLAALQDEAAALAVEKEELNGKISALSDDISANLEKKTLLDGQIGVIQEQIANLDGEIAVYETEIAETEAELADARERETAKNELFRKRVRAMEEQGRLDFWSILLHASSFTDLLTRLDFVNEIMTADQQVMLDLRTLQAEIAEKQAELEGEKAELEDALSRQEARRAELDSQREAANQLIIELQLNRDQAELDMDDLSASEEAVQEEIVRLSEQLAEEEAERRRIAEEEAARRMAEAAQYSYYDLEAAYDITEAAALGGYAWPVASRRITSTFGGRGRAASAPRTTRAWTSAAWATAPRFTRRRRASSSSPAITVPTGTMWWCPTAAAIPRCTPT